MISTLLSLTLLLAQAPSPPPAPPPPREASPVGVASQEYRIGAGDILRIAVYGHDDLTQTVIVQPSGSFVFPLIGAVAAAGATTGEVEARVAGRLAKGFIRDAQVTVAVQEYRSQVVFVVGEVARPGTYPLAGETRIVEILSRAGPLSTNAGSEVVIVRPTARIDRPVLPEEATASGRGAAGPATSPPAEVLRVDVREIQAGHLEKNVLLKPNDTVFVPPAARVFVSGEVRNPGGFPFSAGLTARQAVSLAGGFTEDASTGSVQVVREVGGKMKTLKIKVDDRLQAGDTVVIKAKLF